MATLILGGTLLLVLFCLFVSITFLTAGDSAQGFQSYLSLAMFLLSAPLTVFYAYVLVCWWLR